MLEFEKYEANYIEYNRKFKTLNIKDLSEFCNLKIEPKINYPYATSIPDQLKATLLACRHTYMSIGENSSNVIYSHYLEECDNLAIEKLSKRQLLNYLDELENLGFIECEVKSLGRYGRSKYLTSVLDDREVYQILFF
jgi:Cdc6-like AAA superfamily ATPase